MKNLVTITCLRDLSQIILQAKSIEMFLNEKEHWIIINEYTEDKNKWIDILKPLYHKNKLHLLFLDDFMPLNSERGYVWSKYTSYSRQLYLKFLAFSYIKQDYLILDSKNFFTMKTDLEQWKNITGCGKLIKYNSPGYEHFTDAIDTYEKYIGVSRKKCYLTPHTPFVFRKNALTSILSRYDGMDNFIKWFESIRLPNLEKHKGTWCENLGWHSEFLLYSCFLSEKDMISSDGYLYLTLWKQDHKSFKEKCIKGFLQKIPIMGIHIQLLRIIRNNKNDLCFVNNFLKSLKIDHEL